jgi:competence protein ComEC
MSAPAVIAAIPLVAGVVTGSLTSVPFALIAWMTAIGWAITAVAFLRTWTRVFVGACVCACFGVGALLGAAAERTAMHPQIAMGAPGDPVALRGVLREDAASTPFGVTFTLDVTGIVRNGREDVASAGVRASVAGNLARTSSSGWRQGRTIAVEATLREPTDYRNVGVPNDRARLARQGIAFVASVKSAALVTLTGRGSWPAEAASALRAYVRTVAADAVGRWSTRSAGIVTAVLIGDRSGLDPDDERRLQEAGTYHVIAISGGNIALLTALLLGIGRTAGLTPRRTAALSIGLLAFYGYAAGLAPSVMRATVAGVVYLTARTIDHRGPAMNAVAVAAIVAAATSPLSILDPGFVLSFGATVAIVAAATRIAGPASHVRETGRVATAIQTATSAARMLGAATLCAEIALAPIGASLFGRISLAGLLLNFVAIPLMSAIQIAALAAVAVHAASSHAAAALGWIAHMGAVGLLRSAAFVDVAPWLVIDVPPPSLWILVAWYVAWIVVLLYWRRRKLRATALTCVGVTAAAMIWSPPAFRAQRVNSPPAGWTRFAFLDVGQGDATLVAPPDAPPVLIDAGGAPGSAFDLGRRVTVPALWALGVTRLGTLVLTHGDPDHIGGAPAVLRALSPQEMWEGIGVPLHAPLALLHASAARQRVSWRTVRTGLHVSWGSLDVRVLNPPEPDWERQRVRNDDSIVLEVRIGRVSTILPGDIGAAVERDVVSHLESEAGGDIHIVKAPHHGSAGSSSTAFIDRVHPAVVIFSAGRRNPFGHPSPAAIERYRLAGARIFRTDADGEVIVDTNGEEVVIWTWGGRKEVLGAAGSSQSSR